MDHLYQELRANYMSVRDYLTCRQLSANIVKYTRYIVRYYAYQFVSVVFGHRKN